jgi:RNA polymerase sigma-70 factor (ECF subfamily)
MERVHQDILLDIFLSIRSRLTAMIYNRVRCRATTADITQDTFLRLWERRSLLPAATDLAGYFIRTGRNLAIDHGRRQRIAPFVQGVEHLEMIADRAPSPEDHAISRHELERLQRAISALPPRARDVFVMARLEGMSYVEIGQQLGISPKTVFSHMVTALERLKAEVGRI